MHTLKVSISMPDESHPDVHLHLSSNDSDCDVVIALPVAARAGRTAPVRPVAASAVRSGDDYELGGYAGI